MSSTAASLRASPPPQENRPHACLACGTDVIGPYCHRCGQKNDDCRRSIVRLVGETFADTASLDGRFVSTIRSSFLKPGRHVHDYAHGKRSPFTPPVRFFFVIIGIFFATLWAMDRNIFVLQLVPEDRTDATGNIDLTFPTSQEEIRAGLAELDDETRAELEQVSPGLVDRMEDIATADAEEDQAAAEEGAEGEGEDSEAGPAPPRIVPYAGFFLPAQNLTYTEEEKAWLRSKIGFDNSLSLFGREVTEDRLADALVFTMQNPAAFSNALNEAIPVLMLVFVPLMAILGALFVRGRDALIYDHLLLSIQTHAFAFLILTLTLWTSPFLPGDVGLFAFLIGVPLYYLLGLRGAFRRSWPKSIAATVFVGMVYNTLFLFGLLGAVLVSLWEIS